MHHLDDTIMITPALIRRFHDEAHMDQGPGAFVAFMQRSNGQFLVNAPSDNFTIDPNQTIFAQDVLTALNRQLHHGGAWVIVFTHPLPMRSAIEVTEYGRFVLMWMDMDGDVQFPFEWEHGAGEERDFADVLMSGKDSWLNRCETAWQTWQLHMRQILAPKPDQLVKAAQGQTHH